MQAHFTDYIPDVGLRQLADGEASINELLILKPTGFSYYLHEASTIFE